MRIQILGALAEHNFVLEDVDSAIHVGQLQQVIADRLTAANPSVPIQSERIRLISMGRPMIDVNAALSTFVPAPVLAASPAEQRHSIHMVLRQPVPSAAPQQAAPTQPQPQQPQQQQQQQLMPPVVNDIVQMLLPGLLPAAAAPAPQQPPAPAQQIPRAQQVTVNVQQPPQNPQQFHLHQQQLHQQHLHQHHHAMHLHHQHQQQLLQAQQRLMAPSMQMHQHVPTPAVQVHLHVSLAELDDVPRRLQAFHQSMTHLPPVSVQVEAPRATPNAPSTATPSTPATTDASVAAQATAGQPTRQTGAPAAVPAAAAPTAAAGAPTRASPTTTAAPLQQQPPSVRTLSQLAQEAGLNDDGPPQSLLEVLMAEISATLTVPDMMMLVGGQWAPLERVRGPLSNHLRAALAREDSSLSEAERRTRFASRTAQSMVSSLVENRELYVLLGTRQRPGMNVFQQLEAFGNFFVLQLVETVLDSPDNAQFVARLRTTIVRCVGMLLHYGQNNVFRTPHDLNAVVQTGVRILLTHGQQAGGGAGWQQQLQALGPMAGNLAMNALGQWLNEYTARFLRESDNAIFTNDVRRYPPLPTSVAAPQAAAQPELDLDAVLDEAIEATADDGFEREVAAVLQRAGVPSETVAQTTAQLQQTVEALPSDHSVAYRQLSQD